MSDTGDMTQRRAGGVDQRLTDLLLSPTQTLTVALVIAADLKRTGGASAGAYLFAVGFGGLVLAARRGTPRPDDDRRERATMVGGSLTAGHGREGGFVVRTVLPTRLSA